MTGTVAVVPVRDGRSGKTRLSAWLGAEDRAALVVDLARHVVSTLVRTADVAEVVVVSAEPVWAVAALAGVDGPVRVLPQPADRPGLDAAVDAGRSRALADGRARRLLVVHADLPALAPDDVAALLTAAAPEPGTGRVVLATDRAGTGTNALVLDPADAAFTFRFGEGSLHAHREEAARRRLASTVVRRAGTACDLDTLDDWSALPDAVRERVARAVPALARLSRA